MIHHCTSINQFSIANDFIRLKDEQKQAVKELLQKILAHYNYQGELIRKEARGADVLAHNASNEKVKSLIEYNLTSFEDGLAKTLDWYQAKFSG